MKAELRSLSSLDVDLRSYVPDEEAFCITVTAQIAPVGQTAAEAFDFDVCSPRWLEACLKSESVISGRHTLFMSDFNLEVLESYILKRVHQAEGSDWASVAKKLSSWSLWESEEYEP
jgi:hypothetical protein